MKESKQTAIFKTIATLTAQAADELGRLRYSAKQCKDAEVLKQLKNDIKFQEAFTLGMQTIAAAVSLINNQEEREFINDYFDLNYLN